MYVCSTTSSVRDFLQLEGHSSSLLTFEIQKILDRGNQMISLLNWKVYLGVCECMSLIESIKVCTLYAHSQQAYILKKRLKSSTQDTNKHEIGRITQICVADKTTLSANLEQSLDSTYIKLASTHSQEPIADSHIQSEFQRPSVLLFVPNLHVD